MKFLKLTMQAFGPYKEKEVIDFTNLNKDGLFLITGPTGSGKTSIFDAICYALYGSLSSSSSSKERIRSNYVDENTPTYIELEFSLSNENYLIYRRPDQRAYKAETNRVSNISHEARLECNGKLISSSVSEIDNIIPNLFGLTCDMFRQVVMLPQNEFQTLLRANTTERQPVFRNIFKTKPLFDFQERIKRDCDIKTKEIEEKVAILNTLISHVDERYKDLDIKIMQNYNDIINEIDSLSSEKEALRSEKKEKYDNLVLKNKELNEKYQSLEKLNEQIEEYNLAKIELDKLNNDNLIANYRTVLEKSNNASRLKKAMEALDLEKQNITNLEESIKNLELEEKRQNEIKNEFATKKLELENNRSDIESIREARIKLNQEKESASKFKELNDLFLKLDADLNDYNIDRDNFIEEKDALKIDLDKLNEFVKNLESKLENVSQLYKEKQDKKDELDHFKDIKKKLESKIDYIEKIRGFDASINELRRETLELSNTKAITEKKLKLNRASEFAHNLTNGMPCPVCGATEHPNLAIFDCDVTQDDYNKIVSDIAKANADMDMIYAKKKEVVDERIKIEDFLAEDPLVSEYDLDLDNIDEYIGNYNMDINDLDDRINRHNKINEEYLAEKEKLDELNEKINKIDEDIKKIDLDNANRVEELNKTKIKLELYPNTRKLEEIEDEINVLTEKINNFEALVKQYSTGEVDALNEIIEIGKKVSSIKNDISAAIAKKDVYQKEIDELKALFSSDEEFNLCLNTNYDEITEYVRNYDSKYAIATNTINNLNELVNNKEVADLSSITLEINSNEETINSLNEEIINLNSSIKTINSQIEEIKAKYSQVKDKIDLRNKILKISNLANGKMKFEQYVLGIYFEDVIDEANVLLNIMSKSRYQLVRDESLTGQGNKGLEINVFDNNTGTTRSVRTLSGGESFAAALSLALGISNIIRRNQSFVSIDTLFIDEGFGTLDATQLDLAYNALCSLRQSDRVIGVISHVSELKNRISNQIVIDNKDAYSKIKVID